MKTTIRLIASATLSALLLLLAFYLNSPNKALYFKGDIFPTRDVLLAFAVMLVGIVAGCLFRQVAAGAERVHLGKEVAKMGHSRSFIMALLISPAVFGAIFLAAADNPSGTISCVLAFQNGFFCESVSRSIFPDTPKVK
jgi:formate hydrogenlyase subunit 4